MNDRMQKMDPGALCTGLVLIAVGVAFLIGDFGDIVHSWWPMFIVLVGLSRIFRQRTMWSGLWLIAVGAWLQAVRLRLFDLRHVPSSSKWLWPLATIG